jgi:glycosyltransferase involved in cell wall biosynthesis
VCALVPYPLDTAPSQRFRLEQWAPHLARDGIHVTFRPFVDRRLMAVLHGSGSVVAKGGLMLAALARRAREVARLDCDAVVVHRAACLAGPPVLERIVAASRPLIFDFDDAIFLLDTSRANRRFGRLKCPGKTATLCRISTHVTAGSGHLADYARGHSAEVSVVPSSVDTERYRPRSNHDGRERVVVGWMGSATSQVHLERFAPVLREIVARRPVELRVVSATPPNLPGIPHAWTRWSADGETAALAGFDIGIMPLTDDSWSRGKCAMKALQYMGMGVPTVAGCVGANAEVVTHGHDGFLAATPEDWVTQVTALIDAPTLRARIGTAGRRTVEERYSMLVCAAKFGRAVRDAVEVWSERGTAVA